MPTSCLLQFTLCRAAEPTIGSYSQQAEALHVAGALIDQLGRDVRNVFVGTDFGCSHRGMEHLSRGEGAAYRLLGRRAPTGRIIFFFFCCRSRPVRPRRQEGSTYSAVCADRLTLWTRGRIDGVDGGGSLAR